MIFGAEEEIIPKYYDDDKPKSVQKTTFGLIRIILLWLCGAVSPIGVDCFAVISANKFAFMGIFCRAPLRTSAWLLALHRARSNAP